jgi:hypothetical protein
MFRNRAAPVMVTAFPTGVPGFLKKNYFFKESH